jgi:hypothetical protein
MGRVVDDADGLGVLVIACHDLLNAIARVWMVPDIAVEKLLQGARSDAERHY